MKAYVDDIIVTDASGEKAVLYPKTKQEAVFGLMERLGKLEAPHITETTETTMENSYAGRLEVVEIGGGESEQDKTTGAQLFDADNVVSAAEASFSVVGDKITVTGKNAYSGVNRIIQNIEELIGKTLTLSYKGYVKSIVESAVSIQAKLIYVDNTSAYKTITGATGGGISFDVPENIKNIAVQLFVNNSGSALNADNVVTFEGVMLSIGTEALPWEPYTGGLPAPNPDYPQEIKKTVVSEILTHGKNLINAKLNQQISGNDRYYIYGVNPGESLTMYLKQKTTVFDSAYPTAQHYHWFANKDGVVIKGGTICKLTFDSVNQEKEGISIMTVPDEAVCLIVDLGTYFSNSGTRIMTLECQIEKSENFTGYEPYTESVITLSQPIELYGIGAVQDVIEDGKVKRRFASVIFDGSADENLWQDSTYVFRSPLEHKGVSYSANQLCTHLQRRKSYAVLQIQDNSFAVSSNGLVLRIGENVTTIDELRAWLISHSMTVVYELAEEVVEELPIVNQIALNNISTYDGITYVDVVSDIPPTFKGKYGTSEIGGMVLEGKLAGINGELYGISNADRIAALEATVVNNI